MALKILMFPLQGSALLATRALTPVLSGYQDDRARVRQGFLRALSFILFVSAPLIAGLYALREPFVRVAIGPQWTAVPELLAWLAPAALLQAAVSATTAVFTAQGRTSELMRIGAAIGTVQVACFLVGMHWGIVGMARAYLASMSICALPVFARVRQLTQARAAHFGAACLRPVLNAMLMLAAVQCLEALAEQWHCPDWLQLCAGTGFGAAVYFLLAVLTDRDNTGALRRLFGRRGKVDGFAVRS